MPRLLTALLANCAILAAGGGDTRTAVPDLTRAVAPDRFRKLTLNAAGGRPRSPNCSGGDDGRRRRGDPSYASEQIGGGTQRVTSTHVSVDGAGAGARPIRAAGAVPRGLPGGVRPVLRSLTLLPLGPAG